jgi:hypothetical protein
MPQDRDQYTPDDPEDAEVLESGRHQGTGGSGLDRLPSEEAPGSLDEQPAAEDSEQG